MLSLGVLCCTFRVWLWRPSGLKKPLASWQLLPGSGWASWDTFILPFLTSSFQLHLCLGESPATTNPD